MAFTPYDTGSRAQNIKNLRTNKSGTASTLNSNITKVNNYIKQHDVTSFIKFEVNGFSLDTRDQDSFRHYAISMENQKTGVGQGNKFTIRIAYHKHFSNYSSINQLEYALGPLRAGSLIAYNSDNVGSTRRNLNKNKCTLQYGYLTTDNSLVSPKYVGLLLKYSVKANKQIVEYTLEGYAGEEVTANNAVVNWYPNIVGMTKSQDSDGNNVPVGELGRKGSTISDSKMESLIDDLNNQYSGGITFQPYLALDCFLQDYNASVSSDSTKYYLLDCTDTSNGRKRLSDDDALEPVHLSLCRNQTIMQYAEYCIGLFKYKSTTNYALKYLQQTTKTSERFVYNFVKDPNNDKIVYICVDVIDDSDSDNRVAYAFTGYASDNSLLIDYSLNYDGTVALAISDNYTDSEDTTNNIYIDRDGSIRAKASISRDIFTASEASEVLISKQNTWLDKISIANKCTMTTFGLPFEISVGTVFKCGIYITDTLHHSSGNCYVTGIVDKISNNTFTTEFTMIRLPGRNNALLDNTVPGGG